MVAPDTNNSIYGEYVKSSPSELERLRLLGLAYDGRTREVLDNLDLSGIAAVLELGPGAGSVTEYLASRVRREARIEVIGDDLSSFSEVLHERVQWRNENLNAVELASATYGMIYARSVLHVVHRRERLLNAMAASVALGGLIVVETFDFGPVAALASDQLASVWEAMLAGGRVARVEVNWMCGLLQAAAARGLQVVDAAHWLPLDRAGSACAQYWAASLLLARPFLAPSFVADDVFVDAVECLIRDTGVPMVLPGLTSVVMRRTH